MRFKTLDELAYTCVLGDISGSNGNMISLKTLSICIFLLGSMKSENVEKNGISLA